MPDTIEQVDRLISLLSNKHGLSRDTEVFKRCLDWVGHFPNGVEAGKKRRFLDAVCGAFSISEAEIYGLLTHTMGAHQHTLAQTASNEETALEAGVKQGGWLANYITYTKHIESPMAYHLFASLCLLGTSLGRRVWIAKGPFQIFPNYCVLLIGPPALKKTSCADIIKRLIREKNLCPIFPDQITPEAILDALEELGGHQFIYAGELSVFFGKQRYNEGLATLMLRLLDSPDVFVKRTKTGSIHTVTDVALTVIGASTPSLLATATPEQLTSSGFLSRFLMVVETHSIREFWTPYVDTRAEHKIFETLNEMQCQGGTIDYEKSAAVWGSEWYHQHKKDLEALDNDTTVEIRSRTPFHLERTAMLLHLADHGSHAICVGCMEQAAHLLSYAERKLPTITKTITSTIQSQDADYIMQQLRKLGGTAPHSRLLQYCSSRLDAERFKKMIGTLKEQEKLEERKTPNGVLRVYVLRGEQDA